MTHLKSALRSIFVLSLILVLPGVHAGGPEVWAQADQFQENLQSGETALSQRKYEAAVDAFKKAIRDARSLTGAALEVATAQANYGLSRAYMGLGAFKNALQSCDEALKNVGANKALEAMLLNQRGLAYFSSASKPGDPKLENALSDFRAVLAITDKDPMVSYNLGYTLLKLGRDAEGIHELQSFVARAPRSPEVDLARSMIEEPRRARETFAPEFTLTTVDGELIRLKDLKGKVVLLDFWGSWCPPCRASTPSLVRYSKKHPTEAFVMISVAVNETSEQGWREYIEKNKMTTWPQYLDSNRRVTNLFKVTVFPTYIVLDIDGVVRDRRLGWNPETMDSIDNRVKQALKARAAASKAAASVLP